MIYVSCSLVVTCGERADLLAVLYAMFSCVFITFTYGVQGQALYLIVSFPGLCLLSFLHSNVWTRLDFTFWLCGIVSHKSQLATNI